MTSALSPTITTEELIALDYRYHYSDDELLADWERLKATTDYKTGAQFKPGMKLCQHFFPNFWTIKNKSGKSFDDCWNDPILMEKVRQWGLNGMSQLWLSWVRRAVYMAGGLPNSSFYRPHFAKQIIERTGKPEGVLFDPCAGWGGRMLGTVAAGWKYVGCEPNTETYTNLYRLIDFLEIHESAILGNTPAEQFHGFGDVDIVLTSPPYFNLEVYCDEETQSYNRYTEYGEWFGDWLKPLIESGLSNITEGGISAWNVMNIARTDLVGDVIRVHEENGWKLVDTLGFQSPLSNIRKLKNKDVTYIFERN